MDYKKQLIQEIAKNSEKYKPSEVIEKIAASFKHKKKREEAVLLLSNELMHLVSSSRVILTDSRKLKTNELLFKIRNRVSKKEEMTKNEIKRYIVKRISTVKGRVSVSQLVSEVFVFEHDRNKKIKFSQVLRNMVSSQELYIDAKWNLSLG